MAPSSYFKGIWLWAGAESTSPGWVQHPSIDFWWDGNRLLSLVLLNFAFFFSRKMLNRQFHLNIMHVIYFQKTKFLRGQPDLLSAVKISSLAGVLVLAQVHDPCSKIVRQHIGRK